MDWKNTEKREKTTQIMHNFFKSAVEVSNANIIKNSDHLLTEVQKSDDNIALVGSSKKKYDNTKSKLKH